MSDVDRLLPRRLRRKRGKRILIVIADHRRQVTRLQISRTRWRRAPLVTLVGRTTRELHEELAALNQARLVVDVRARSGRRQLDAFARCFFHLGPGDTWVALRELAPVRRREPLVDVARRLRGPEGRRGLEPQWRAHHRATAESRVTRRLVVVVKRGRHLLRLREKGLVELLRTREPRLRVSVVEELPGGLLRSGRLATEHGGSPEPRVPDTVSYPPHTVRRYEGRPLHLPKAGLVHTRRSLLPDSFRWHLAAQTLSPGLRYVDEHFSRVERMPRGERLDGSYFLLLYSNTGHFGHLMTEALAKLWGWPAAKAADPSLKVLCRLRPSGTDSPETRPETTLLTAYGIAREDIVWVDGPVTVTSLVGCTPMWHNTPPFYVHPRIHETWTRLREGLVGSEPGSGGSRIFVTRREGNRPCSNVEDVERLFAAHGFTIVSPKRLTLAEQAAAFAAARVVAGFGGAGMFNLLYSHRVEDVIVLNQWAYHARNEHLFATAHGARAHYFWSRPQVDNPDDGRRLYRAHQSGWTFDFGTNAEPLSALLESLSD